MDNIKAQGKTFNAARVVSFLAVLCLFTNFFLVLILNNYFPLVSDRNLPGGVVTIISMFSFLGVCISSLLCPLFLPLRPGQTVKGLAFVLALVLPNVLLRSMGVELWIHSPLARACVQMLTGMLYPVCLGLFLQTHTGHAGKYCAFVFALAMSGGVLIRDIVLVLLKNSAFDPLQVMTLVYDCIKWLMVLIGGCIVTWIIAPAFSAVNSRKIQGAPAQTNWPLIFHLIGLDVVLQLLNSAMQMRLFPRMVYSIQPFAFYPLLQTIAVPILALIACRGMDRFLKALVSAAICLVILIPCLLFFEYYPRFIVFINLTLGLFSLLIWVIFTVVIIEHYAGGFWFFGLASVIYFTKVFTFTSPMVVRLIPEGTGFTILISGIAAVLFVFLALRILFGKNRESLRAPAAEAVPAAVSSAQPLEGLFRQYGLTKRETEVAALVVQGLENEEIANRLLRATITIKSHISSIYRKFGVRGRPEFISMVLRNKA